MEVEGPAFPVSGGILSGVSLCVCFRTKGTTRNRFSANRSALTSVKRNLPALRPYKKDRTKRDDLLGEGGMR